MRAWTGPLVAVLAFGGLVFAAPASAESCAAHLARTGSTEAADIAYHAVHGGESPCAVSPAVESSSKSRDQDGKSRFCRKRWYC
jgi:hypothetical protein